jgi:hypothetical protein
MSKKSYITSIFSVVAILAVVAGVSWFNRRQSDVETGILDITNPATTDTSRASQAYAWIPYRNEQVGFEAAYPDTWTIDAADASSVSFRLPDFEMPVGKSGEVSKIQVYVGIGKSLIPRDYPSLEAYEKERDANYATEFGSNWGYVNRGYEIINDRRFFKHSIAHQVGELRYATLVDGHIFQISLSTMDAVAFEDLPSWPDFLKFLDSIAIH